MFHIYLVSILLLDFYVPPPFLPLFLLSFHLFLPISIPFFCLRNNTGTNVHEQIFLHIFLLFLRKS